MKKSILLIALTILLATLFNVGYTDDTEQCTGKMGDVKMSLLGESKFIQTHGYCWKPMNGNDIKGTPLAQEFKHLEGKAPNAAGRFFRVMDVTGKIDPDGNKRKVASPQKDSVGPHKHPIGNRIFRWDRSFEGDPGNPKTLVDRDSSRAEPHGPYETQKNTSKETRPKNITVFAYVHTGSPRQ